MPPPIMMILISPLPLVAVHALCCPDASSPQPRTDGAAQCDRRKPDIRIPRSLPSGLPVGGSVVVDSEDHAVPEVLGSSECLSCSLTRCRPRSDKAEAELQVQLPVRVPVQLAKEIARRDARAQRSGLIDQKVVEDEAGPEVFRGSEVQPHLVRDEVRVRNEVPACDLALPPGAPVVGSKEQRVEGFAPFSRGIVPLEEGKPIRE